MKIVELPNKILKEKAKRVNTLTPKTVSLIKAMKTALKRETAPTGVGLAAPQVGLSLQIFLIMPPNGFQKSAFNTTGKFLDMQNIEVFVNPVITSKKGIYQDKEKSNSLEGCLSLHGYYGHVKRANEITIEYELPNLEKITLTKRTIILKGFPAVIAQHEADHLEGKLFIDRILEQKGKLYKIEKDSQGKEILQEVNL